MKRKLLTDQELQDKIDSCTKTTDKEGSQYIHYKANTHGTMREFIMKQEIFDKLTKAEKKRLLS